MILMEGLMLVPPERGTIIGRAVWKARYVVLGTGAHLQTQTDLLEKSTSKKGKNGKSSSKKPSLIDIGTSSNPQESLYISIYKAKGDWEYIAQHPLSAFRSCEIRSLSHRKQSPPLPTLMLEFKPDSITEKQRKRRSSRTGGLSSGKDAQWADTLLFRSVPEERHSIYDWQIAVKPRLEPELEESPMSPLSPVFTTFSNPFAARDELPASRNGRTEQSNRLPFQQPPSSYAHAPRDRPSALISPSPSLRSRRSDLSSQASSSHPPMGFTHTQNYAPNLPSDLPSPISVSGYENFIEGWTSAQGRSSALSHHTRGSNSIASVPPALTSPISPSPGPRETILDRAFQMRCIPGSERLQDDEEKISSIARFEALMKEADERRLQKSSSSTGGSSSHYKPGWELEEESEESDNDTGANSTDVDERDRDILMPTPAQRALDYIAGRRTPLTAANSRPMSPKSPSVPYSNSQAMNALNSGSSSTSQSVTSSSGNGLRPRTGTTSHIRKNSRPSSLLLPSRSMSTTTIPTVKDTSSTTSSALAPFKEEREKRSSSTSQKRLSFQEFARRLSSTSSLLLVQTNASSNSGRGEEGRGSRRGSVDASVLMGNLEESEETGVNGGRGLSRGLRSSNGLSLRGGEGGMKIGRRGVGSSGGGGVMVGDEKCGFKGNYGGREKGGFSDGDMS
ncbi:hypothetical protein CJF30_00009861 [Rutstroemia sp. NJR-2017a BBW]|nr:hypothetical protein CJF30_00009861 [Rutstroemia sp. NJR-2017a BBW]